MGDAARKVQTILIAGAEGALGRQAITFFARRGLKVLASCRTADDQARLTQSLAAEGLADVVVLVCDLGQEESVRSLVAEGERRLGPIDALLNAAGGFRWVSTESCTVADFDFLLAANLKSSFLLAKHLVPGMRQRGFGRLVFVSSRATLGQGEANLGVYTASKAALNALVGSLAAELRKTNVRVNAVLPSVIDTPANRQAMAGSDPADWVSCEALCEMVATLWGPVGAVMNGALVPLAGRL